MNLENIKECSLIVIAKKSRNRLGARFYSRGTDSNGNVSNFVETEQILKYKSKYSMNLIII